MIIVLVLSITVQQASAAPDLKSRFDLNGVRVFQDHLDRNIFYYAPLGLRLSKAKSVPVFRFDLFRYMGRKETGDRTDFSVRGILSFEVEQLRDLDLIRRIGDELRITRPGMILRPAPIERFHSELIFKTVETEEGQPEQSGTIEGGLSKAMDGDGSGEKSGGNWKRRLFTIGMKPLTAELFWENFEKESLQLSLSYHWSVHGVVKDETDGGTWTESTTDIADTLPINISISRYPELFRRIETWQKMGVAYTNLMVTCYDFINESDEDLYSVIVEVMFKTLRGQDYVEQVRFKKNDHEYEKQISFRLAKDLDAGYQFRIRRIFRSGETRTTKWKHHDGQVLDVTYNTDYFD